MAEKTKQKSRQGEIASAVSRLGIYFILLGMIIVSALIQPTFLTITNQANILRQMSVIILIGCAETIVIIMNKIDLAAGSVVALSGIIACFTYLATGSLFCSVLAGMAVGMCCGFIMGTVITKCNVPPFIVGLAMMKISRGLTLQLTNGDNIYNLGSFSVLGQGTVGNVLPIPAVIVIVVALVLWVVLNKTCHGRYIYAVGGNEKAAAASGIHVDKVIVRTFMLSGAIVGLAGVVLMSRLNAGMPNTADGYEFEGITAAIIGGTSFLGGIGTIQGTLVGGLVVGILQNIMNLKGIESFTQQIVKGLIILLAVVVDINSGRIFGKMQKKK